MNLKVLLILAIYWTIIILTFGFLPVNTGFSTNADINDTSITINESEVVGSTPLRTVGIGRWLGMVFFGVNLPGTVPGWFSTFFAAWQSIVTLFTLGFVISIIWDG